MTGISIQSKTSDSLEIADPVTPTRPLLPSRPTRRTRHLLERIRVLHAESDGVLGAARICEDLQDEGESWKHSNGRNRT